MTFIYQKGRTKKDSDKQKKKKSSRIKIKMDPSVMCNVQGS